MDSHHQEQAMGQTTEQQFELMAAEHQVRFESGTVAEGLVTIRDRVARLAEDMTQIMGTEAPLYEKVERFAHELSWMVPNLHLESLATQAGKLRVTEMKLAELEHQEGVSRALDLCMTPETEEAAGS